MSLFDTLSQGLEQKDEKIAGVVVGTVTNNQDPEGLGRVKVNLTIREDNSETNWAPVATMMAGPGTGSLFIPEVGDKVLVAFLLGDPEEPYVIGTLWDSQNTPPPGDDSGFQTNNVRKIVSRKGHELRFDDSTLLSGVTLSSRMGMKVHFSDILGTLTISSGFNKISMNEFTNTIEIFSPLHINIWSGFNTCISLSSAGVGIYAPNVSINAGQVSIRSGVTGIQGATGVLINGGIVKIN
ncbi:MAG: phage baseplate assembly protein V [Syntrophomonas sp.]